ncbi:MAG TPA: choice-of-anchor Q domain-containing protein, partial [Chitinophagales bacterium]|nr:choice-of-anchor Q domain-containing protein [Chitinophagales bacterium]
MKKQFTPSLAFLLCLLLGWQVSQAGHFYVSTLSGNAAGSLEWALTQVNADNSSTIANPHVIDICVGGDVSLNPFPTKNCVINCPKDMSLKIYSIYCYQGSSGVRIIVNNAVIDNGPSSSFGGAVFGGCGSTLMLNNCYIANNTNQHQGAVFSNGDSIFLNGCTFYNNITTDGGGEGGGAAFNNGGYMRITNCTFSKNRSASTSASGAGGAVKNHAGGRMDIINCTFYNNRAESRGGALQNAPGATCRISNCIFVGNTAAGSGQDLWGEFQSLDGHNLFSDTAGAVLNGVVTGNIYGASTLSVLDTTLRDNGHYMLTHALVAGSPAINGAEPSVAGLFDQREYLRNGTADMGSFEYNGTNPCAGFSVAIDAPLPDCLPVLNNLGFVITGGTAPYSSNWYNVTGSWLCGDSLQHFGNGEFIATVFDTAHCVAKDTIVLDYTLPEIDYTFSICGGDSVTVNGITYYLAGNYTQNYNCDSVIEISIDYGSEPVIERNYTICSGQSVNVGTNTYTAAGTYTDFFACDSVLITNLNILPLPALPVYSIDGVVCHDDTGSIQLATASPMQLTLGNNSYFFGPDTVWADFVIAYSSQYSSSGWSAQQLLGPPNTYPSYGDISTAWTANDYGNNRDFLVVGYSTPVTTNQVLIYETNAPGHIDSVYVDETSGNWL